MRANFVLTFTMIFSCVLFISIEKRALSISEKIMKEICFLSLLRKINFRRSPRTTCEHLYSWRCGKKGTLRWVISGLVCVLSYHLRDFREENYKFITVIATLCHGNGCTFWKEKKRQKISSNFSPSKVVLCLINKEKKHGENLVMTKEKIVREISKGQQLLFKEGWFLCWGWFLCHGNFNFRFPPNEGEIFFLK